MKRIILLALVACSSTPAASKHVTSVQDNFEGTLAIGGYGNHASIGVVSAHMERVIDLEGRTGTVTEGSLSFSPDGSMIAFTAQPNEGATVSYLEVYTVHADGTDLRKVTHCTARGVSCVGTAWSPDGAELYYAVDNYKGRARQVFSVHTDGTAEAILANTEVYDRPSMSPDGNWLAVTSLDKGGIALIQPKRDSEVTLLSPVRPGERSYGPSIGPDGSVAYVAMPNPDETDPNYFEIRIVDRKGAERTVLHWAVKDYPNRPHVVWSPDGTRLAFSAVSPDSLDPFAVCVFTVRTDGADVRQVTTGSLLGGVAWTR